MDVYGLVYAHLVAWQSLFLLQYRKTNEVLLLGFHLQESLQNRNLERRQMM